MSDTSVLDPVTSTTSGHWRSRPALARLVRYGVFLLPLVLATTIGWLVAGALPAPTSVVELLAQWAVIIGVATLVVRLARPLAKRLLPLSALLELTLVFPDIAPSRTATALRRPSEAELQALVETTRRDGLPEDAAKAASTILTLVAQLSRHDRLTRGHSERVRVYAGMIAEELGMSATEKARIQWAGLLHDIGKLTVDGDILNKPGRLNAEEYEAVKLHTVAGAQMVEPLRAWLGDAVDAVGQHHERWDGQGYPNGLSTTQISLEARIISVADVFDVITAQRSYKEAFSPAHARQEIADNAGTQFDPRVVRAFLAISLGDFRLASGPLAALAQIPALAAIASAGGSAGPAVGAAMTATLVLGTAAAMPAVSADDLLNESRWAQRAAVAAPEVAFATTVLHATSVTDVAEATSATSAAATSGATRAAKTPKATSAPRAQVAVEATTTPPAPSTEAPAASPSVTSPPPAQPKAPKAPKAVAKDPTRSPEQTDDVADVRADAEAEAKNAIADAAEDAAEALAENDASELREIAAELAEELADIEADLAEDLAKLATRSSSSLTVATTGVAATEQPTDEGKKPAKAQKGGKKRKG